MALGAAAHAAEVMQAIAEIGKISNRAADIKDERAFQTALTIYTQQAESKRRAYEMQLANALNEYNSIQAQKREALKSLSRIGLMDKAKGLLETTTTDFNTILNNEVNKHELKLDTLAEQESFYKGKIDAVSQLISSEEAKLNKAFSIYNRYSKGTTSPLLGEALKIAEADKDFNMNAQEADAIRKMLEGREYSEEAIQGVFDKLPELLQQDRATSLEERKLDIYSADVASKTRSNELVAFDNMRKLAYTMLEAKLHTIDGEDPKAVAGAYKEWYDWTNELYKQYGYSGIPSGLINIPPPEEVAKKPGLIKRVVETLFDKERLYGNLPEYPNPLVRSTAPSAGGGGAGYTKQPKTTTTKRSKPTSNKKTTTKKTTAKKTATPTKASAPSNTANSIKQFLAGAGIRYSRNKHSRNEWNTF